MAYYEWVVWLGVVLRYVLDWYKLCNMPIVVAVEFLCCFCFGFKCVLCLVCVFFG